MIEVTELTKKYGNHTAVDHLSFRVEKGQIYGFLGPNGAGKSTTMNIITGYTAASGGSVAVDGKDIRREPEEARKRIGYLPEVPPLYVDMTVEEYLVFAAQLKKVQRAEQKKQVQKVMEMTQTVDVRKRLIRNLSKGYRQRVGLAQAVLGDPEIIILDEPSVGLDPKQIIEIRDLIRRLGEDHTIILSSHILSEVSNICDHIMILSKGRLAASDSPEGLRRLMAGAAQIRLTVRGDLERLTEVLRGIPRVASIEPVAGREEGHVSVKVVSQDNTDIREAVFYALAEAELPLMELTVSEKSLEDIFLELTEGGQEKTAGESLQECAAGEHTGEDEAGEPSRECAAGEHTGEDEAGASPQEGIAKENIQKEDTAHDSNL